MNDQISFSGEEERAIERLCLDRLEGSEIFVLELDGKLISGHGTKFFEKKSSATNSFRQKTRNYGFPRSVDMSALYRKLIDSGRVKVRGIKV